MAQKSLNPEWKEDLFKITKQLTEEQFEELKFFLRRIPESKKCDKTRVELTQLIVDHYKEHESISAIKRIMKKIPKWDPVVQNLLRPHVEKLKQQRQENEQLPQQERGRKRKRKHDSEEKENGPAAALLDSTELKWGDGERERGGMTCSKDPWVQFEPTTTATKAGANMMSDIPAKEWKQALTNILEELDDEQYNKMIELLPGLSRRQRTRGYKENMPQKLIEHYGVELSVREIRDVMYLIPRKDPTIRGLLHPFVEKLSKIPEKECKGEKRKLDSEEDAHCPAADPKKSCPAPTKEGNTRPWTISIRDVKYSRHIHDTKAMAGKVIQKSGLRPYKTKDNVKKVFFYVAVADGTESIKLMIYGKAHYKTIEEKKFYTFRKLIIDDRAVRVIKLSTVSKTYAVEVPEELEKEAEKLIYPECPLYSVAEAKSCDDKTEVNVEGTVTLIDPVESVPVQRQEEKTKTKRQYFSIQDESGSIRICMWGEETKLCKGLTVGDIIKLTNVKTHHYYDDVSLNSTSSTRILKIQSAGIQKERIEIIGIIKATKRETELEAEFKEEVHTFVVPSQLLAKTFEIKLKVHFEDSLLDMMPLFADVEIQGNEIIKMTDVQKTSE